MQDKRICLGCFEEYGAVYHICPRCGYAEGTSVESPLHMEPATVLHGRYVIGRVLGSGSFGVTYIAWDTVLQIKVAVKEYLPGEFSTRAMGQTKVSVYNGNKEEQFHQGMMQFVKEAQRLAKLQKETGIVKVYDSFHENDTAYIIMEYLSGETLSARLEREGSVPAKELLMLLLPVMQSLNHIHSSGIIHRDVSPENIILTNDGTAKLIDFGAARHATTTHSRSLEVVTRSGFSPEEQYRSNGEQGAHTDVYAMAATLYKAVTGITPPEALARRVMQEDKKRDSLREISDFKSELSENQKIAIMNALNVYIENRTPDMEQFIAELTGEKTAVRKIERGRRGFVKWPLWAKITLPAAAACAIGFGVITAITNVPIQHAEIPENMVRVPAVINTMLESSVKNLESKILLPRVISGRPSTLAAENVVMSQKQDIGSYVLENTVVEMEISTGVENNLVPDVTGMYAEDAEKRLNTAGYAVSVTEAYSNIAAEGTVVSQDIAPGEKYDLENIVTIIVSKGIDPEDTIQEKMITMPDLSGMSFKEASDALVGCGMQLAVSSREYSTAAPENSIIYQSIAPGQKVMNQNVVEVMVSLGNQIIRVENVFCKPEDEAIETLREQGLNVVEVHYEASSLYEKGLVISQVPEPGKETELNTDIVLTISSGYEVFEMPDVRDMTLEEAKEKLLKLGMVVTVTYRREETQDIDVVLDQNIEAGAVAKPGDPVILTVNAKSDSEIISVPDVTGMEMEEAAKKISRLKLQVAVNEIYSDEVAAGHVVTQMPPAGIALPEGGVLTLTVSLGRSMVAVPELTGKTLTAARTMLDDLGLKAEITEEYNNTVTENRIISQTPEENESLRRGDAVKLVVSKGKKPVSVPDVVGMRQADAISLLTEMELTYSVQMSYSDTVEKGYVISQNPHSGQEQHSGDRIVLVVSRGEADITPERVILNRSSVSMRVGDTMQLLSTISPADASDKTVSWESSDRSVVSVSNNGMVQGVGAGTATITVRTNSGGCTASCKITVSKAEVSRIEISAFPSKLTYYSGERLDTSGLRLMVVYQNGKTEIVEYGFSASCSMEGEGAKNVQVIYEGKSVSYQITIIGIELTLNISSLNMKIGDARILTASSTVGGSIQWSSSDSSVASVNGNGTITAGHAGTAVITASITVNGIKYEESCTVTVTETEVSLSLPFDELQLYVGMTRQIAASVIPGNTRISWESSNSMVAMVGNGQITAVSPGTAVITASITVNGTKCTDSCTITVAEPSVNLSSDDLQLYVGTAQQITASATPGNAEVSWESNNSMVAMVSEGRITAVSPGTAVITASILFNEIRYTDSCTITVIEPSVSLPFDGLQLYVGMNRQITASAAPSNTDISWESDNSMVAMINGGQVTAVSPGIAVITASMTMNGVKYTDSCTISVLQPSVSLSSDMLSLYTGDAYQLTAWAKPESASISWESNNSMVAMISGGQIIAVSSGTATITASITVNGIKYTDSCIITVSDPVNDAAPDDSSDSESVIVVQKSAPYTIPIS